MGIRGETSQLKDYDYVIGFHILLLLWLGEWLGPNLSTSYKVGGNPLFLFS